MKEQEIRNKILKGAEELFMRYGIRSISMDDIARHLAVSKKTLYQYVADKDELVLEVAKMGFEEKRAVIEDIRSKTQNPIEELAMLSSCMRSMLETVNPSLFYDLEKFYPRAWSVWKDFKRGYLRESIIILLKQGIEQGFIRDDIDVEIMASLRIEMVQLAFQTELFPGGYTLHQIQEQLFDLFVHGLLTDKGRKLYKKYKTKQNQLITIL
jgi:AcrR family transcriptional regulator